MCGPWSISRAPSPGWGHRGHAGDGLGRKSSPGRASAIPGRVRRLQLPDRVAGPAAVTEPQTTTIVPEGFRAALMGEGHLVLERLATVDGPAVAAGQAIREQIIWNRMISIVEEQAQALIRTAFSTTVREAGDLSAGVFDASGRMIAQAVTGTPGHVNTMAAAVGHFINDIGPERIYPGDVYVTNDPWKGTGHLHDITVTTPVFATSSSALPAEIRGDRHGRSATLLSPQDSPEAPEGPVELLGVVLSRELQSMSSPPDCCHRA